MTAALEVEDLTGGRGPLQAFRNIDLAVEEGTVLTLLGPNGAGKTTLLLTLAGILPAHSGVVAVVGAPLPNGRPRAANRAGLVFVPDDRCLFTTLTVEENLRAAAPRDGRPPREMLDLFPGLEPRWRIPAGALSGGEQQMLVLARALIQEPKVLLVDELSMGLAPMVVRSLFSAIRQVADAGCAVVIVEQHVPVALGAADEVVVLNRGEVALRSRAADLTPTSPELEEAYLGAASR